MKPKPVAKETVCSACGLSWPRHEQHVQGRARAGKRPNPRAAEPTLETCVALLKHDLATFRALPLMSGSRPFSFGNMTLTHSWDKYAA